MSDKIKAALVSALQALMNYGISAFMWDLEEEATELLSQAQSAIDAAEKV